jgi:hypothetical protein
MTGQHHGSCQYKEVLGLGDVMTYTVNVPRNLFIGTVILEESYRPREPVQEFLTLGPSTYSIL